MALYKSRIIIVVVIIIITTERQFKSFTLTLRICAQFATEPADRRVRWRPLVTDFAARPARGMQVSAKFLRAVTTSAIVFDFRAN